MLNTIEAVRAAERTLLTHGVARNPGLLPSLLATLAVDEVASWSLHSAALHSARRVFTHLHHSGALQARSSSGDGSGSGAQQERELCQWLQQQFGAFLGLLGRLLVEGGGAARVEARVLALSTVMHFCAHAAPLSVQSAPGGPFVCQSVLLWLTRHALAAGGEGSAHLYGAGAPPALLPLLTASLAGTAAAYRSQFIDDYDDLRLAALKALRDVCRERLLHASAAAGGGPARPAGGSRKRQRSEGSSGSGAAEGGGEGGMGGEALSRALLAAAHCSVVCRNALELLLSITLPPTQKDWDEAPRESWGEAQLGEALKGRRSGSGSGAPPLPTPAPAPAPSLAKFLQDSEGEDEEEEEEAALKALGSAAATSAPSSAAAAASRHAYGAQCRAFGEALLAVLALPLPPDCLRRVLLALPRRLLPLLPSQIALQLSDFLTHACASGGANALLALESLFYLQQRHGLEFPRFYTHLYALLGAPATVHAKYKARFFSQLDLYMTSTALPAYLVAAFAKRALRVALGAPVGAALFALPFAYNLLKRHASLGVLLHRASGSGGGGATAAAPLAQAWPAPCDPYDSRTDDPSAANALASSLWEVMALAQHAYAPVAHAARALLGPLAREEYDLSEDGRGEAGQEGGGSGEGDAEASLRTCTYAAMAGKELGRMVKRGGGAAAAPVPVAFAFASDAGAAAQGFGGVVNFGSE